MQMNFQKGDVLAAERKFYKHYGIYAGNGTVIHFVGLYHGRRNLLNVRVRKTSYEEFERGSKVFVDNSPQSQRFSQETILANAEKFLDDIFIKKYNLITNNCEHFARFCENGKRVSKQVSDVKKVMLTPITKIKRAGKKAAGILLRKAA